MKLRAGYPSRIVEGYAFLFQQSPLHFKAPLVAAKMSVRANGSVTRHDKGKRVVRQGIPHGPRTIYPYSFEKRALLVSPLYTLFPKNIFSL